MEQLKVEYVPIDSLTPYENNARKHEAQDIEAIAQSISEFGFSDPIGVWGEQNTIVEGHGRLLAAIKLGMEEVPIIRLDHLTEEQRKAYALAHNKTAELSGWNFVTLEEELSGISGIDMTKFGFDESTAVDIDGFFADAETKEKEPKKVQCPFCGEWFEP